MNSLEDVFFFNPLFAYFNVLLVDWSNFPIALLLRFVQVNRVRSVDLQGYVLLRHNDPRKDEVVDLPPMWMEESQEDMDKQPWRKYLQ